MPWWGSNKPKLLETAEFYVIDHLKILPTELGTGSYGTVYGAEYDGKACVAKEIHPYLTKVKDGRDSATPLGICIKEINTLSTLRHPSIVQFLGVHFKNKSHVPILVMERLWKSVFFVLNEWPNQLPLLIKTHILYDVACGLQYLHGQKNPVVHRDLNINNILLTTNLEAKIADLGQAKALVSIDPERLSTNPGNIAHMPPEALQHKPTYDAKLDIFSFGCTIIHLVTESLPRPAEQYVQSASDPNSFRKQSEIKRRQQFIDQMTNSKHYTLQQIAIQCLQDASISRPSAQYLCKELEKLVKKFEAELPKLAKQYKQDKLDIIRLLQSKENELDSTKTLMNKLKEEIENHEETNKQLTAAYKGQAERYREDLSSKIDEITEAKAKIVDLQQEAQDKIDNETAMQSELAELKNRFDQLSASCKSQVDQFKKELNMKDDDVKKADERTVQLQKQIQTYQIMVENEATKLSKKDEKIASLENDIQKAYDTLATCKEESKTLLADKNEFLGKNNVLTQELAELRKRCKVLQSTFTKQKDSLLSKVRGKVITDKGSNLHKRLLELQEINEGEHQKLQQHRQSYVDAISQREDLSNQLSNMETEHVTLKQQLEDMAYNFNELESSFSELQVKLGSKKEKLKSTEERNTTLEKSIENSKALYKELEKQCKDKDESLNRKELELQIQMREHADEISNLNRQHSRKVQSLVESHGVQVSQPVTQEMAALYKEETQCRLDLTKSTEQKLKQVQNELKSCQKNLKRQKKQYENFIKEQNKSIKDLENVKSDHLQFDIHWYAHMSLPVKTIRPNATLVKDKVFLSEGYENVSPHGKDLNSILETSKNINRLFCFNTVNSKYDPIASPVVLGGVASVNGQCVLVSGAEGNTLTGNVYVLCEEGSDEQWKKFSEPVPTPRILPCVCCYSERWLIVCGGYVCKEGSNLLEAVNVVEILDMTKGEWNKLSDDKCPNVSTAVLFCTVVAENLYIIGDGKIIKNNCNEVSQAAAITKKSKSIMPQWSNVELGGSLCPFSIVEVAREPVIIASISGSEDDVTCVLMKDTTDTWRKMSEAVECQHCSAVVVTPTLELLLFGGSETVKNSNATDICQCCALTPSLNSWSQPKSEELSKHTPTNITPRIQDSLDGNHNVNQPPNLSFTGPIHTKQFDHKGGTFQSPVHKVSIVVPPNAIDDGEKVSVYMGATTSGPFDLPEDSKLRSAVVWVGSDSDVVLKRSIAVIVPHSAVFTSPQHHSMMRFLTCEDCEGPRYKFEYALGDCCGIDEDQGWIELCRFAMVAIATSTQTTAESDDDDDDSKKLWKILIYSMLQKHINK